MSNRRMGPAAMGPHQPINKATMKRLLGYVKPYWPRLILVLACVVLNAVATASAANFLGKHETVELCFRKRISTFLFYRVLCCEYEERSLEFICLSRYGNVFLLHRFEEGCLCFRRCSVDFVGEDDVGEHRTFHELKLT